jgi:hypothetical protein
LKKTLTASRLISTTGDGKKMKAMMKKTEMATTARRVKGAQSNFSVAS